MMIELKPCPFCGGAPFIFQSDDEYRDWHVECEKCSNRTSLMDSNEEAATRWNARASGRDALVTRAMLEAGRERAVAHCVRIEDFMLSAIYTAMHRAAISAYNPDDRLREALEAVFSVTDLYRDVFGSECLAKLDEARSALSPLPQGDG